MLLNTLWSLRICEEGNGKLDRAEHENVRVSFEKLHEEKFLQKSCSNLSEEQ